MGLLDKTKTSLHNELRCKESLTLCTNLLSCNRWCRSRLWSRNLSFFYYIIVFWLLKVCQLPCKSALRDRGSRRFQGCQKKQFWCWRVICFERVSTKLSSKVLPSLEMSSPPQEGHLLRALSRTPYARNGHRFFNSPNSLLWCSSQTSNTCRERIKTSHRNRTSSRSDSDLVKHSDPNS